jgi:hypothetical protein
MRRPGSPPTFLFRLIIPVTAVFIITIMSMIAVVFSDERAPVAQFLNRHGNTMLVVEFVAVIIVTFVAMAYDRYQTLRAQSADQDSAGSSSSLSSSTSSSSTSGDSL